MKEHCSEPLSTKPYLMPVMKMKTFLKNLFKFGRMLYDGLVKVLVSLLLGLLMFVILLALIISKFVLLLGNLLMTQTTQYNDKGIECIEAIEAALTPEEYRGYLRGQVMKYTWRCNYKGKRLEDLQKARWYLNRYIELLEKE